MVCAHNPVRTGSNLCDGFTEQLAFNLAENGLQQFPVLIKGIPCSVLCFQIGSDKMISSFYLSRFAADRLGGGKKCIDFVF